MATSLLAQLQNLGLQDSEAKVYLALLEMGRGTVSEISKAAHLNRTSGYDILERLALYGITNRSTVGKKRMYVAEPPSRLKQYLENKKRRAEERLGELREILPDLQSLYKTELKPSIKFFEGMEGISNIYSHALGAKGTIYSILDLEQYLPDLDWFGKEHIQKRVEKGVKEKVLARKSEKAIEFYGSTYKGKKSYEGNTEYRWLEHNFTFSPAAEVMIYDDVVIGVLFKPGEEEFAFEIKSQSFASSLKVMFELVWNMSQPIRKFVN